MTAIRTEKGSASHFAAADGWEVVVTGDDADTWAMTVLGFATVTGDVYYDNEDGCLARRNTIEPMIYDSDGPVIIPVSEYMSALPGLTWRLQRVDR